MKSPFLNMKGAGDLVHAVAQPIAKVIDKATAAVGLPTNVRGCGKCPKTRAWLNNKIPLGKK